MVKIQTPPSLPTSPRSHFLVVSLRCFFSVAGVFGTLTFLGDIASSCACIDAPLRDAFRGDPSLGLNLPRSGAARPPSPRLPLSEARNGLVVGFVFEFSCKIGACFALDFLLGDL